MNGAFVGTLGLPGLDTQGQCAYAMAKGFNLYVEVGTKPVGSEKIWLSDQGTISRKVPTIG